MKSKFQISNVKKRSAFWFLDFVIDLAFVI